ncbi:M15 family metallopeptidase [Ruminococcus sp. FC2018]|uniref:M15 family metallopeptidase n=1 Tax=Ruminococcus sp. FC2018 TaxID=1410617 RepID=UPI0006843D76|nr:M15 family metallopeptidase [Ruminococcus sp. FC2018]
MDYLMIVNRFEPLEEGFEKRIKLAKVRGVYLEKQTALSLEKMLQDAQAGGIDIQVISGFRSADYQQLLWEREISKEMANGLDYRQAVKKTGETLALPHCSEHETGLAVDFAQKGEKDVGYGFACSSQSVWLERNAHRYGFILRYPRLKEHITGIAFEPWHYRYVGSESASIIKKSGICLEEFLDFYQDKYLFVTNRE